MNSARSKTQEIIDRGKQQAKQQKMQMANAAEGGREKIDRTVESRPAESLLVSYVAGVGFGLLIGVLLSEKPSKHESLYSNIADQIRDGFATLKGK
jgi:ElaB/YqjD/DUF883 family membrane-anchored ribosome-binding protein